jgi:hypothetical protein
MSNLTNSTADALSAVECQIDRELANMRHAWRIVGILLRKIQTERLYQNVCSTFEEYCRERWGLSRSTVYEWIDTAEVVTNAARQNIEPPQRISHARILARLPSEHQAGALTKARENAERRNGKEPTKRDILLVVNSKLGHEDDEDDEQRALCKYIEHAWSRLTESNRKRMLTLLANAIESAHCQ